MKVYDVTKTKELAEYDLTLGYLKEDFIVHTLPEQKEQKEEWHYETIAEYKNGGKDVKKIIDKPFQPYLPEREEQEQIQVYVPYTDEELFDLKQNNLRFQRQEILLAFDKYKTNVVYGIVQESEEEKTAIFNWYKQILDLEEQAFNNIPKAIIYYMK